MYFKKERPGENPFLKFGKKRKVYRYFFEKGLQMGFEMYLVSGEKKYLGGLKFKNPAKFNGKKFIIENSIIIADAIYDRSGGLKFPSKNISSKVLNNIAFKSICFDKNKMQRIIGKFMPKSFKIKNQSDFDKKVNLFSKKEIVVVKPSTDLGGKGIIIDTPENIFASGLIIKKEYVLQKFVDTSYGIKGLTKGRHDLRIVIVDGKMIYACLRTPRGTNYLANVAQGGEIREIPLNKVPTAVKNYVNRIKIILDKKFGYPVYSVDFGIEKGKPFVFELNDQIGFPSTKMRSYPLFVKALIESLKKIAAKNDS